MAEFSFAGVIAHADDERTGNLVPEGEDLPPGLDLRKRYAHCGTVGEVDWLMV